MYVSLTPTMKSCLAEGHPRDELGPQGVKFTPLFTPRGEHSLLFRRMEGRTDNFTPRGQTHPWGTTSPLGVKVCPPEVKLRMGLWHQGKCMYAKDNNFNNYSPTIGNKICFTLSLKLFILKYDRCCYITFESVKIWNRVARTLQR
jgi:hypothetical protein